MNHVIDEDDMPETFNTIDDTDSRPVLILPRPRPVDELQRWKLRPAPRCSSHYRGAK